MVFEIKIATHKGFYKNFAILIGWNQILGELIEL